MGRIGVLISGSGTNLQAVIDACDTGEIAGEVGVVISTHPEAYGLERAKKHDIPSFFIKNDEDVLSLLREHNIDLVVLAGYLRKITREVIDAYPGCILNIHPSLIPAFSGAGFYGMSVHEAALERGVKVSGATVHEVTEGLDEGPILYQETVPVYKEDKPEDLQQRILEVEHRILVQAVADKIRECSK